MKKSIIIKGIISLILAGALTFMIYSIVSEANTIQKARNITQSTIEKFDKLTAEAEKKVEEECIPCKTGKENAEPKSAEDQN